ncbi:MAG: hypothetical protein IJS11_00115, partial [Oscillospiraceae bacterium]|nr:hypothetical protein [Oscillospiraceae bacterium]
SAGFCQSNNTPLCLIIAYSCGKYQISEAELHAQARYRTCTIAAGGVRHAYLSEPRLCDIVGSEIQQLKYDEGDRT